MIYSLAGLQWISTASWVGYLYNDLFIRGCGWSLCTVIYSFGEVGGLSVGRSVCTLIYSLAGLHRISTARRVVCLYCDLFISGFT